MSELNAYLDRDEITQVKKITVPQKYVNEIQALQDLLVYALKGVSMYAHRCRQLLIIDSTVDLFTEKTLRASLFLTSSQPKEILPLLEKALEIRERAKTLYEWSLAPFSKKTNAIGGPAVFKFDLNPYNIGVQAQIISFEKKLRAGGSMNVYLEDICLLDLNDLLERSEPSEITGPLGNDIFALVHNVLNTLAENPDTAKLTWLVDRLSECYVKNNVQTNAQILDHNKTIADHSVNLKLTVPDAKFIQQEEVKPTMNIRVGKNRHEVGHRGG